MGSSSSKDKGDPRCPHCAFSIAAPTQVASYCICKRCHGVVPDPKIAAAAQTSAAGSSSAKRNSVLNPLSSGSGYGQLRGDNDSAAAGSSSSAAGAGTQLPLERIDVVPFFESLPPEHQALTSSINYESAHTKGTEDTDGCCERR